MKTSSKNVCCSRCGDQLSPEEIQHLKGSVCALCEHMQAEALDLHTHARQNPKRIANPGFKLSTVARTLQPLKTSSSLP